MIREFTEDLGRWGRGTRREWPLTTWRSIASNVGRDLDSFSREIRIERVEIGKAPRGGRPPKILTREIPA